MITLDREAVTFDLDGVIRNLSYAVFGRVPMHWNEKINGDGVVDFINKHAYILHVAPPTKYYETIKDLFPKPNILTHQAHSWINNTELWLSMHFDDYIVKYTSSIEDKTRELKSGLLVEDYPNFPIEFYKRVILIRYPYNENVKEEDCYAVVNSPEELREVLKWT